MASIFSTCTPSTGAGAAARRIGGGRVAVNTAAAMVWAVTGEAIAVRAGVEREQAHQDDHDDAERDRHPPAVRVDVALGQEPVRGEHRRGAQHEQRPSRRHRPAADPAVAASSIIEMVTPHGMRTTAMPSRNGANADCDRVLCAPRGSRTPAG